MKTNRYPDMTDYDVEIASQLKVGANKADAYFLPRGLIGFKKTAIANKLPVVSAEVDRQVLNVRAAK